MSLSDIGVLALKGLVGGTVVVLFAVVGEVLRPRSVAGVTSGAPSVALASLAVTVAASGGFVAARQAHGMVVGAVALVVACLCGLDTLKRFGAVKGSVLAVVIWIGAACALWGTALR
jgi:uncharacterized membrane protein (GlpM family)